MSPITSSIISHDVNFRTVTPPAPDAADANLQRVTAAAPWPRVTVFIPVYNRARFVGAAIESILAQTYTDFELLLIDDGSTDDSLAVMQSYRDSHIRIVHRPDNRGIPATRNDGLALAHGEYIALLDSDDCAVPERLARQVAFLDRHPEVAAVGSWFRWVDEDGEPLGRVRCRPLSAGDVAVLRLFHCPMNNSTVMARTSVLRTYGYREWHTVTEDFDLWNRMARDHALTHLPLPLVWRRRHAGQIGQLKRHLTNRQEMQIMAAQLDLLGVGYTALDLDRHHCLPRIRKLGFKPDLEYLLWAEQWLTRLREANRRVRLYPSKAFERALGNLWCAAVWHASQREGLSLLWRVWRLPSLCAAAFTCLAIRLRERTTGAVGRLRTAMAPAR